MNTTTQSRSTNADDAFIRRLLDELEESRDYEEIEARFVAECSERAAEVRRLIKAHRLVEFAEDPPPPPDPERLGDFTIIRRLGVGGMGVVYLAYQESLKRLVAVKTIRADGRWISPESRRRFQREQEVLALLQHEGIVPVFAAGEEAGLRYFAMKYVPGMPLNRIVRTARAIETSIPDLPLPSLAVLADESVASDPGPSPAGRTTEYRPDRDGEADALPPRVRLSAKYVRSVAHVMRDVAEALQYAHGEGVLHRDLKPSNIMVDAKEKPATVDFGLAEYQRRESSNGNGHVAEGPSADVAQTVGGAKGTPQYMAPEAYDGKFDVRTDVYGLGVTLYELLTLRPPFPGREWKDLRESIKNGAPVPISRVAKGVPADIAAICRKAMAKRPEDRYQTAEELAEDLGHWMNGEPTMARPARAPRRVWMWARRNKGWAALVVLVALLISGVPAAGFLLAHEREQAQARQLQLIGIQREASGERKGGFSRKIIELVGGLAPRDEDRIDRQRLVGGALTGLDVRPEKEMNIYAQSLAFGPDDRLWMGTTGEGVRRFDPETERLETWPQEENGPLAVRPDGTVWQLGPTYTLPDPPKRLPVDPRPGASFPLRLLDVERQNIVRTFADPVEGGSRLLAWTMSPLGSHVAATVLDPQQAQHMVLWDADTGKVLHRMACARSPESSALPRPGVTFAPDASVLASWDGSGRVDLWDVVAGRAITGFTIRQPAQSVAFGKNHWLREAPKDSAARWMVAVGDTNGYVTLWHPGVRNTWHVLHAGGLEMYSLAFNPDGTLLSTSGRSNYPAQIWDVATGQRLIDLVTGDYTTALAFSPDGQRLVSSRWQVHDPRPENKARTIVFRLEPNRGIRHLHGLPGGVAKTQFSRDGQRIAALSWDWWAGVWDRETGRLVRLMALPRGQFADNAAFTFSPDGRHLATSGGNTAMLWDLEGGEDKRFPELPWALTESLMFDGPNRLMLFRTEVRDGSRPPDSEAPPSEYPRVCVLRNLLGPAPTAKLKVIKDFPWKVQEINAAPDGSCFAIEGVPGQPVKSQTRSVKVFDPNGEFLNELPAHWPAQEDGGTLFDPTGRLMALRLGDRGGQVLFEMPTGRYLGPLPVSQVSSLAPGARLFARTNSGARHSLSLHDRAGKLLVGSLAEDLHQLEVPFSPDKDGRYMLWGKTSGLVSVADLVELQRQLNALGLGW